MIKKFIYNDEMHQYERVDRVQEYKGIVIETITYHRDYIDPRQRRNHREYRLTYPNGETSIFPINKRGGNIEELKSYIDFKEKHNS